MSDNDKSVAMIFCKYCGHYTMISILLGVPKGGVSCKCCGETKNIEVVKKPKTYDVYGYRFDVKEVYDASNGGDAFGYRFDPPFPDKKEQSSSEASNDDDEADLSGVSNGGWTLPDYF